MGPSIAINVPSEASAGYRSELEAEPGKVKCPGEAHLHSIPIAAGFSFSIRLNGRIGIQQVIGAVVGSFFQELTLNH